MKMKAMKVASAGLIVGLFLACVAFAPAAKADAATINFSGTAGGEAVSGTLVFTVSSAGTLTVSITDNQANPTDVGQLISDLSFNVSNMSGSPTLTASSGQELSVSSSNVATVGNFVTTEWSLQSSGSTLTLTALSPGPDNLIIGPGPYTNANGSIAEHGPTRPHNPFLDGTVTFTLSVSGLTSVNQLSNVIVSFGTTPGDDLSVGTPTPTPEPSSLILLGTGLLGLGAELRRRMKA